MGCPPGLTFNHDQENEDSDDDDEVHEEFHRRVKTLYLEIFPQHEACDETCEGHSLPDMPLKFLTEMAYPVDMSALTLEARKWLVFFPYLLS